MSWRVARSLLALREQVDRRAPGRDRRSDGTIGDADHRKRTSDHNPWVKPPGGGVVTALDLTHDPAGGLDAHDLAEQLRRSRDPRIKYIISDRRICSSTVAPWTWRRYNGANPHTRHVHVSVVSDGAYDAVDEWDVLGDVDPGEEDDVVRRGQESSDVHAVQDAINSWLRREQEQRRQRGGTPRTLDPLRVDGAYGPKTAGAVATVKRAVDWPDTDGDEASAFFVAQILAGEQGARRLQQETHSYRSLTETHDTPGST